MSWTTKIAGFRSCLQFDNWLSLVISRTFFRKHGLNIYRKNGLEFIVDHQGGDECGTRAVLLSEMYRRHLAGIPRDRPINVMDLGANGGGFLLLLKLMGFRLNRVVAVEMNPYTFGRLYFNVKHNLLGKATLRNQAVAGTQRTYEITLGRGSTGDSLYQPSPEGSRHVIQSMTFTQVCEDFEGNIIDVCKIDVEGAEHELFDTYPDGLDAVRHLIMEIHGPLGKQQELKQKVRSYGFLLEKENDVKDSVYHFVNGRNLSSPRSVRRDV